MSRRVRVYYDSTRRQWSIKANGQVAVKALTVCLVDCRMVVSTKARDRVRVSKRKTPHAYIEGVIGGHESVGTNIRYNPYSMDGFTTPDGSLVESCESITMKVTPEGPRCYARGLVLRKVK